MLVDFSELAPNQVYHQMIQALIPRPIAWVLSENPQGRYNLAPFSYFTAVSSDPPLIMISVGKKPDGSPKDTGVNIEQRKDFVVHIAHEAMLEALNASSRTLGPEISEVDELDLETIEFPGSRLPRLAKCRIALACTLYRIQNIGKVPQSLIFGRVNALFVDDAIADRPEKGRLKINAERLAPVSRLGADQYSLLGRIIELKRPA